MRHSGELFAEVTVLVANPGNLDTFTERDLLLKLPDNRWITHPDQGSSDRYPVDVAVMRIPELSDAQVTAFTTCSSICSAGVIDQLASDALPPDQVLFFGFPEDFGIELAKQRPIVRHGIVSLVAEQEIAALKVDGKFVDDRSLLIDALSLPGNSGSPVVEFPVSRGVQLVGLMSAALANHLYAVAEPASRIKDTLRLAKDQDVAAFQPWQSILKYVPPLRPTVDK